MFDVELHSKASSLTEGRVLLSDFRAGAKYRLTQNEVLPDINEASADRNEVGADNDEVLPRTSESRPADMPGSADRPDPPS